MLLIVELRECVLINSETDILRASSFIVSIMGRNRMIQLIMGRAR